jgi:hypothetical protein
VVLVLVDLAGAIRARSLRGVRFDAHRFDWRSEAEPSVARSGSLDEDPVPAVRVIEQGGFAVVLRPSARGIGEVVLDEDVGASGRVTS